MAGKQRKRTKRRPTLTVRKKKKINNLKTEKGQQNKKASDKRSIKCKTFNSQLDDAKAPGPISTSKENVEEEIFELPPAYLCDCTLQTEEASLSKESCPETTVIKRKSLKKGKTQRKCKKKKSNYVYNHSQVLNPAYLCESILQTKETPVSSKSDISKEYCSNTTLVEHIKKEKPPCNRQKLKKNEVLNHEELSPVYLRECTLQTQETPVSLKSNLSKECSKTIIVESKTLKKGKQPDNRKKLKNNEVSNHDQDCSPAYFYKSLLKNPNISVTFKSVLSKENCSNTNILESKSLNKEKLQSSQKKLIDNNKVQNDDQEFSPAYLCESILKTQNVSVTVKSGFSKEYSNVSVAESKSLTKGKRPSNQKKLENNKVYNHDQEFSPAYLFESTLQTQGTSVTLKSDLLKQPCSKKRLVKNKSLKRVQISRNQQKLKNNQVDNQDQGFSPAYLCEPILQTPDVSVTVKPGFTKEYCSNISVVERKSLKKGKRPRNQKKLENKKVYIHDQEFSPAYLCESTLQTQGTSVTLKPDLLKQQCSNNRLVKNKSFKRVKIPRNQQKLKNNKVDVHQTQFSPAFLCESTLQMQDTSMDSKSDLPRQYCSNNRLEENKTVEKGRILRNRQKLENSKVNNQDQEFSPAYLCESILQTQDTSVTSKSDLSKEYCSKSSLVEKRMLNKGKLPINKMKPNDKKVQNKDQVFRAAYLRGHTLQTQDTSVSLKSNLSNENCSNISLIESKSLKKKKRPRKHKKRKNNKVRDHGQAFNTAYIPDCTLKSENTLVVSESDLSSKRCFKEGDLLEKKELFTSEKELQNIEVNNQKPELSTANLCESTLQTQSNLESSKSYLSTEYCSKNVFNGNSSKKGKLLRSGKELKVNEVHKRKRKSRPPCICKNMPKTQKRPVASKSNLLKEYSKNISLLDKLLKNEKQIRSEIELEYNHASYNAVNNHDQEHTLCESTLPTQVTIVAAESDVSKGYSSNNSPLERNLLKKEENLNSSTEISCKDINGRDRDYITEEISFIECNSVTCDSKVTSTLEFIEDLVDPSQTDMDVDPLECHLVETDLLEGSSESIDLQEDDPLESDILESNVTSVNCYDTSEIDTVECDLNLECHLEDSEPVQSDLEEIESQASNGRGKLLNCNMMQVKSPESVTGTTETRSLGRFSVCNLELNCDSDTIATYPCDIEVPFEPVKKLKADNSQVENNQQMTMSEKILLESDNEKMKLMEINYNETEHNNTLHVDISTESGVNQTNGNNSLQQVQLESLHGVEEKRKIVELAVNNENKSEKFVVLENSLSNVEPPEFSSSKQIELQDESSESSPLKKQISEDVTLGESKSLESAQSESIAICCTKDNDDHDESKKNFKDDEGNTLANVTDKSSSENNDRCLEIVEPNGDPEEKTEISQPQMDSLLKSELKDDCPHKPESREEPSQQIRVEDEKSSNVITQKLNLYKVPVLKVLLRRLEDEEVFQIWKKNGVVSLLGYPQSKKTLNRKQTNSLASSIQKPFKMKKNFKCPICKRRYINRERYWEHRVSRCDRLRVFGCDNCNRKYILKKMLDEHRAKCVSVKYFKCKICFKLCDTQERLEEHNASKCDTKKVFHCNVCGRSFVFRKHLLIHSTPICVSLRRYKCSVCNRSFHKNDLKTHKIREHGIGTASLALCEVCGKLISSNHLKKHMYSHSGYPVHCKICSKAFKSYHSCRWHERSHLDIKPCVCADCGKTFRRLSDLKKHVSNSGFHKCNACGKVIKNLFCFRAHVKSHIKEEDFGDESLKLIKEEPSNGEYLQHVQEIKIFKCSKCEESFTERIAMEEHLQCVHQTPLHTDFPSIKTDPDQSPPTVPKPFKCDICSCRYLRKQDLNSHMRKVHNNSFCEVKPLPEDKPFKCQTCGNTFLKQKNLNRHIKRIHNVNQTKIVRVFKTPTEERPFACEICRSCFREKRDLRRHHRRMHSGIDDLLYPCNFCQKKFKTNELLKDHTFEHFKDCFTATTSGIDEEKVFASTDLKEEVNVLPNTVYQQPLTASIYIKEEEKINNPEAYKIIFNNPEDREKSFNNPVNRGRSFNNLEDRGRSFNNPEEKEKKSKMHTCRECGKSLNTSISRKRHVCLHKLSALQKTAGRDLHTCEECGVVFNEKWNLKRHLLSHSSQTFTCDVCKKCYTSQLKLSLHMLVHGVRFDTGSNFKCSTCDKSFATAKKLESHSFLHTDQSPHQCTKCYKRFTTPFSLKRHTVQVHGDKCFVCDYCKMSFVSFSSLNQHVMYVHKKTVSMTEYVLKIEDDLQDEAFPSMEVDDLLTVNLNNKASTVELNLQPQLFPNLSNGVMFNDFFNDSPLQSGKQSEFREDLVNANDIISGLNGMDESHVPMEVTVKIEDW